MGDKRVKSIPVSAAEKIAKSYGYDQVIIVARKTGEKGREHVTTYGKNKEHCSIAARCGDFLKYTVMKWHKEELCPECHKAVEVKDNRFHCEDCNLSGPMRKKQ